MSSTSPIQSTLPRDLPSYGSGPILLFGNNIGINSSLTALRGYDVVALVAAANRPHEVESVRKLGEQLKLPVHVQPYRKQSQQFKSFVVALRASGAKLFVSNSYSMILNTDVLSIPTLGVVNIHGGLLPQYRGANVLNWALVNGETETGVTIHYMDEGVDTGDIIIQERIPIDFEDTAVTLRDKLVSVATPLLKAVIPRILDGTAPRTAQNNKQARHWPRRRPEDGWIDWSKDVVGIYNLIRALVKPWPGAFYYLSDSTKVVIDEWMPLEKVRRLQRELLASGNVRPGGFSK